MNLLRWIFGRSGDTAPSAGLTAVIPYAQLQRAFRFDSGFYTPQDLSQIKGSEAFGAVKAALGFLDAKPDLDAAEFDVFAIHTSPGDGTAGSGGDRAIHGQYKANGQDYVFLVMLAGPQEDKTRSCPELTFHARLKMHEDRGQTQYVAQPDLMTLSATYPEPSVVHYKKDSETLTFMQFCTHQLNTIAQGLRPVLPKPIGTLAAGALTIK